MSGKTEPDTGATASEFASFVLMLDDGDLTDVIFDRRFPAYAELLHRHCDGDDIEQALARLMAAVRSHSH